MRAFQARVARRTILIETAPIALVEFTPSTDTTSAAADLVYNAFGEAAGSATPDDVDFLYGYTGREYDPETGLNYHRARYYDPRHGRFLSEDPSGFSGGDANLYRYVGNNVVNATDPTGLATRGLGVSTSHSLSDPFGLGPTIYELAAHDYFTGSEFLSSSSFLYSGMSSYGALGDSFASSKSTSLADIFRTDRYDRTERQSLTRELAYTGQLLREEHESLIAERAGLKGMPHRRYGFDDRPPILRDGFHDELMAGVDARIAAVQRRQSNLRQVWDNNNLDDVSIFVGRRIEDGGVYSARSGFDTLTSAAFRDELYPQDNDNTFWWAIDAATEVIGVGAAARGGRALAKRMAAGHADDAARLLDDAIGRADDARRGMPVASAMRANLKRTATANLSSADKGMLGEIRTYLTMRRAGFEELPGRLPGNQGFDGVWIKRDPFGNVTDLVITESKFSSAGRFSLSDTTSMGRQMSNEWIGANAGRLVQSRNPALEYTGRLIRQHQGILRKVGAVIDDSGVQRFVNL